MADNVVALKLVEIGEGVVLDGRQVLQAAIDAGLRRVVVIGEMADGEEWVSSNVNAGESLIMIERARNFIVTRKD